LGNEAFGDQAASLITIRYRSHQDALEFMQSTLRGPNGIGLLRGSEGAGKTVLVGELANKLSSEAYVAIVDGTRLKPRELLAQILTEYGYEPGDQPNEEFLAAIEEFAAEQAGSGQHPVLIIDNVDRMYPAALRILNTIAGLSVEGHAAIRIMMTSQHGVQTLTKSDCMASIAEREPAAHVLEPLSSKETVIYLHARLQAAGSNSADTVFPFDVCDRLLEQSKGWPGLLNKYALEAMKRTAEFPISVVDTYSPNAYKEQTAQEIPLLGESEAPSRMPPRLVITKDGETLAEFTFKERTVLIGRSDFADVIIDDDFVSKIHAVLLLYTDALVLLDLNSFNGTTVNSVTLKKTILRDDDIISLGDHRIKVVNAPAISDEMEQLLKSCDTLKMKNLLDVRHQQARRLAMVVDNN
jgi:type II secretory pathway predicted ATPase ExeA